MAARLRPRHQDEIREKIRAAQLVKRLEDHVLKDAEMTKTQVSAAGILLKKCIPDLSVSELTGADGAALFPARVEVSLVKPG